jgi:hypothetical protein
MPIAEHDPWRLQYFERIDCPAHIRIPTDDGDAWSWYSEERWLYDKLAVALSQGLIAGPHGVMPPAFPVFSKPIMNLRGMGTDSRVLLGEQDYRTHQRPGHMWMPLFVGEHVSSDVAVVRGRAQWWRHAVGVEAGGGTFDSWEVLAEARPDLEDYCGRWLASYLSGYSGLLNLETIGGRIIEVHLRFADQWPDLYGGDDWVRAVIELYATSRWNFADANRSNGYSVPLFGPHGYRYRHPPPETQARARAEPGISSLQITFHEGWEPGWHAMPRGGFRLAIANGRELAACRRALAHLQPWYDSTRRLVESLPSL